MAEALQHVAEHGSTIQVPDGYQGYLRKVVRRWSTTFVPHDVDVVYTPPTSSVIKHFP